MIDGTLQYCRRDRCPFLHTITGPVQRVSDVTDPLLQSIVRDRLTLLPFGPRDINCSYDRSCNLSCPSCRTTLIVETNRREQIERIHKRLTDGALNDAEFLYITGSGDPFGSPHFRDWLRTMRRADMPKLKTIHLHSNAVLWTRAMWNSIPEEIRPFVRSAEISIDAATPETYSVNRRGGRFDVLLQNLSFISELRRNGPLTWLCISMVVQQNNFREMPAFVNLGRRFGVDSVYFSQITNWGTFSEREFSQRAVHWDRHPDNSELRQLLANSVFDERIVSLGNLSDLRPPVTSHLQPTRRWIRAAMARALSPLRRKTSFR